MSKMKQHLEEQIVISHSEEESSQGGSDISLLIIKVIGMN
jgi:hypothetical protein